jgi:aminopeptidase
VSEGPPRRSSRTLKPDELSLLGPANRVVNGALGVVAGERFLVVADRSRKAMADALVAVADGMKAKSRLVILEDLPLEPESGIPAVASELLANVDASVLLVGAEHSHAFRRGFVEAVEKLMVRHAHIIGISQLGFIAGFNADSSRVSDMVRAVYLKLMGKTHLRYSTPAGTKLDIRMPPDARWVERGEMIRPGKWLNLPGGQLNVLAGEVDGVFVADACSNLGFNGSADLRTRPITFVIAGSVIQKATSTDPIVEAEVNALLKSEEKLDHVGHIVIGANPGLSAPMGEAMIDACVPGLQLVFGWTNQRVTGASWTTVIAFVTNGGTGDLDVDGVPLLRSGRYIF